MNVNDIAERQKAIRTELATMAAADDFTPEMVERTSALDDEYTDLQTKADAIKRAAAVAGRTDTLVDVARVAPRESSETMTRDPLGNEHDVERVSTFDNPWDTDVVRASRSPEDLAARALSAAEQTPGPSDARREALTRLIERGEGEISKLVLASTSPAYKTAYGKIVRAGGDVARAHLTAEESAALEFSLEVARAVTTTDANGGYLVPTDIEPTVTLATDGTNNPIWNAARRVQTTGDTYRVVQAPHAAWSWDGEAAEVSDDTPTFANTDIPLYFAQGFVPVSIAGNQSIQNVTQVVSDVLMGGWTDLVGAALTTGSGGSQPTGLVTALAASAGGASLVPSATTDTYALADVYNVYDALPARHRRNAIWLAEMNTISDTRQFATDDGNALLARLGDGDPQRLLGRPLVENEDMDGIINADADNYTLILGDMQHFVIAEGIGMLTEIIPHVFGGNGRPIGARGFYCATRFGSDSVLDGAFRMLNVT